MIGQINYHRAGHFGKEENYKRIRKKFYWKRMQDDIFDYVNKCEVCCRFKRWVAEGWHEGIAASIHSVFDN